MKRKCRREKGRTLIAVAACVLMLNFAIPVRSQEEVSDWFLPLPPGTTIIEYPAISLNARRGPSIEIVNDLTIGDGSGGQDYMFYRPQGIAVAEDGRMFVLDAGNHRVQVFDAGGHHIGTLGARGNGPGEFERPSGIGIVDGRVVVYDFGNTRLALWSLDGAHLEDRALRDRTVVREMAGTDDGEIILLHTDFDLGSRSMAQPISKLSVDESEIETLVELLPWVAPNHDERISIEARTPAFAVGGSTVFVTPTLEYQVVAMSTSGQAEWAVRVPGERVPYPEPLVAQALEMLRRGRPSIVRADLVIPEFLPAIAGVRVDGHGHLYVFLQSESVALETRDSAERGSGIRRPVDVYAANGERLYAGMLVGGSMWEAALGDFVYALELDGGSGEEVVVRQRLSEPF